MNRFIKYLITTVVVLGFQVPSFAQNAVEEVIVTATRKEESLQDIALSVQVLSGEDIDENKILSAADLQQVVPGFSYGQGIGSGSAVQIRGLSVPAIGAATTDAAGTAVNNHYVNPTIIGYIGFMDAENVQVLEGPQGTLYGRNTTTGLMNVITNKYGAGNYVSVNAGENGYGVVKMATDLDLGLDNLTARLAYQAKTKDGMVRNKLTGRDIDSRDASSGRLTLNWNNASNQSISLMYEHHEADDTRFNLGTGMCSREAFYGCDPRFKGDINEPYMISGTVSNLWADLVQTNRLVTAGTLGKADYYSGTEALAGNNIGQVYKTRDIEHAFDYDLVQLEHTWDISDDLEIKTKYSYSDWDFIQVDDNSHSHPSSKLVWDLGPLVLTNGANSIKFRCMPEQTSLDITESIECSNVNTAIDQLEVNIVSDFDGPHNFTAGAYYYESEGINQYSIQTTAYAVAGDFRLHPMSDVIFAGALDGYSGTTFYQTLYGTIAQGAAGSIASVSTSGLSGTALAIAQGTNLAIAAANTYGTALGTYAAAPTSTNLAALQAAGAGVTALVKGQDPGGATTFNKIVPWENRGSMTDQRSTIDTSAIFGEYYYQISDDTKLTLGFRVMDDNYTSRSTGGLLDGANGYTSLSTDYETGWAASATSSAGGGTEEMFKVALQHNFLDDSMVYVSGTTGVRPGGIEPTGGLYDAEETTSLELGTRNIFLDGALKLNATYFSHETEGAQFSNIRGFSAYVESQDFTQTGFQLQAEYNLTESTVINLNALAIESEFDGNNNVSDVLNPTGMKTILGTYTASTLSAGIDSVVAPISATLAAGLKTDANSNSTLDIVEGCVAASPLCAAASFIITTSDMPSGINVLANPLGTITCLTCSAAFGNNPATNANVSSNTRILGQYAPSMQGKRLPGAPELDYNISVTQFLPVFNGMGSATLLYSVKGDFYTDMWNRESQLVPEAEFIDVHTYYRPNNGDWYVSLWVKNLEDKRNITSIQSGSPLQGGISFVTFDEGMRAGLEWGMDF